jgi:AraC family transcriptional regulator of adaptative response/methylated-DNA-[protein]-cysteine methyltransferase
MSKLPSRSVMVRALLQRDPAFEGVFFAAVKTTGIFCRPTCTGRKPKPENVVFYTTASECLHAGFRPCLICRPLERERRAPALVTRLLAQAEKDPTTRLTDKDLVARGIDPSTARRQFRRWYGMTFQAYQRARRMGLALRDLGKGGTVAEVHAKRGFASTGGFRKAFGKLFGAPPRGVAPGEVLLATRIATPLGTMIAVAGDEGLYLLEFVDRRALEREIHLLRRATKRVVVPGRHRHLDAVRRQLGEYFRGARETFDLPLVTAGTPFQKAVWDALREIPSGATRSYADIARTVGSPAAVRAVGRANGLNRIAIAIPCHRVIGSDGQLTGYGGGLWRKQRLLDLERDMANGARKGRAARVRPQLTLAAS